MRYIAACKLFGSYYPSSYDVLPSLREAEKRNYHHKLSRGLFSGDDGYYIIKETDPMFNKYIFFGKVDYTNRYHKWLCDTHKKVPRNYYENPFPEA